MWEVSGFQGGSLTIFTIARKNNTEPYERPASEQKLHQAAMLKMSRDATGSSAVSHTHVPDT